MVGRPVKAAKVVKKINDSEKNTEVEQLRKEIEELKKLVLNSAKSVETKDTDIPFASQYLDDESNEIKISGDDYIKVMSLCPHVLNLTTEQKGRGKLFMFKSFGEVKRILYSDLVKIIENHNNFLHDGLFIILNNKVVRRHGLDEVYAKILTKEKINAILNGEQSDAVNLFKSTNLNQQKIIIDIIVAKLVDGLYLDLNLIDRISRAYKETSNNPDFDISNIVKDIQANIGFQKSGNS
jgi:hypothetical protein